METKLTRPDLSFITRQTFSTPKQTNDFAKSLSESDADIVDTALMKLPELIQIAEMYFDEKKSNPESLVFQMVSKVLNDIKPE